MFEVTWCGLLKRKAENFPRDDVLDCHAGNVTLEENTKF